MRMIRVMILGLMIGRVYVAAAQDNAQQLIRQGLHEDSMKNYNAAIADYDKAIKVNGANANLWFYRGNAWFHSKDYSHAIKDYDKALELKPDDADALYNRA